jgi:hypothetical protein
MRQLSANKQVFCADHWNLLPHTRALLPRRDRKTLQPTEIMAVFSVPAVNLLLIIFQQAIAFGAIGGGGSEPRRQ